LFGRAEAIFMNAPQQWPLYLHGTGPYLLSRFSYSIVYRENSNILQWLRTGDDQQDTGKTGKHAD